MKKYLFVLALFSFVLPRLCYSQWAQLPGVPGEITAFAVNGTALFAGTDSNGVYRTTDGGASWSPVNTGLPIGTFVYNFAVSGGDVFVGAFYPGIYRTTNNGESWDSVSQGLYTATTSALAANGTSVFACVQDTVYRTTNNGVSWAALGNGLNPNSIVRTFGFLGQYVFAGFNDGTVYRSTDEGASWASFSSGLPAAALVTDFAVIGTNLFVSTTAGIYVSTDYAAHWSPVNNGMFTASPSVLAAIGTDLFAGTYGGGLYLSKDNGASWDSVNSGLPYASNIRALTTLGSDMFVGTYTDGVWHRAKSQMITGINEKPDVLPAVSDLKQNYPNPFSGMTNIEFQIPNEELITLSVYNALGEKVATLADGVVSAGAHSIPFSAEGLQNGIYFYRLTASEYSSTGVMTVLR